MRYVTSKDGTSIAFTQSGQGPALIIVVGAFNDHSTGLPLTSLLEKHFTVINYDRRGRGDSGDTAPYAVEREIEDLDALITEVGGSAAVFGYSSGAILALKAVASGAAITQLALYEPPLIAGDIANEDDQPSSARLSNANGQAVDVHQQHRSPQEILPLLTKLIAEDRRGDAVELFQTKIIGIPVEMVAQFRQSPFWPSLEKIAHTLVYETMILGNMSLTTDLTDAIPVPTLIMAGSESPAFLQKTAQWLGHVLPIGQHRILDHQTHDIVPDVVAPVVETFLTDLTGQIKSNF
jgi:pimeloyl-ACP methyl ester carboxylesterase